MGTPNCGRRCGQGARGCWRDAQEQFDADRYAELEDIIMQHDGYALEARAAEILRRAEHLPTAVHRQPLSVLSGGFKLRVLLAQTLAAGPTRCCSTSRRTTSTSSRSAGWRSSSSLSRVARSSSRTTTVSSTTSARTSSTWTTSASRSTRATTTTSTEAKKADRDRMEGRDRQAREGDRRPQQVRVERFKAKPTKARQAKSKAKQIERIVIERAAAELAPLSPVQVRGPAAQRPPGVSSSTASARASATTSVLTTSRCGSSAATVWRHRPQRHRQVDVAEGASSASSRPTPGRSSGATRRTPATSRRTTAS